MRSFLFILLLGAASLAEPTDPTLTGERRDEALRQLLSMDRDTRRQAHQALSQLGEQDRLVHQALLKKARTQHASKFQEAIENIYRTSKEFSERHRDWLRQCEATLELGNQDLANDASSLRKLSQLQTAAARSHRQLPRLAQTLSAPLASIEALGKIILELDMEMALLEGEDERAFELSLEEIYESVPYGDHVSAIQERLSSIHAITAMEIGVGEFNASIAKWPSDPQRAFAKTLNTMRSQLGLTPLYLQRELCQASIAHSAEMHRLGYFAHTSPVPTNANPALRAFNAKYEGRWQGENIYMGSNSAQAAYDAWWKSDEHRKIMLMKRPNHLGIGLANAHWTMTMGLGEQPHPTTEQPD